MVKRSISMADIEVTQCIEASNGVEALEILDKEWVDIVFVDLNMPVMGGTELVERMAADNLLVSIPVVIVSADQDSARIEDLRRRGIRAYIKKPFRPENFRDAVNELLLKDSGKKTRTK
jgi:two-component system chemotaxis response regulator CheY